MILRLREIKKNFCNIKSKTNEVIRVRLRLRPIFWYTNYIYLILEIINFESYQNFKALNKWLQSFFLLMNNIVLIIERNYIFGYKCKTKNLDQKKEKKLIT
jgi:hypothetical protein